MPSTELSVTPRKNSSQLSAVDIQDGGGAHNITDLLDRWRDGDAAAANRLMELVYDNLHRIAASSSNKPISLGPVVHIANHLQCFQLGY